MHAGIPFVCSVGCDRELLRGLVDEALRRVLKKLRREHEVSIALVGVYPTPPLVRLYRKLGGASPDDNQMLEPVIEWEPTCPRLTLLYHK
jgi:hypothetical protein